MPSSSSPQPGDTPPLGRVLKRPPGDPGRVLKRPPGDRYERRARAVPEADAAPPLRTGRALAAGTGVALLIAFAWVVPATLLDLDAGLILLAAVAGWLIATAVRVAAGAGPDVRDRRLTVAAVGLGAGCWLLGTLLDYVTSLALVPGSSLTLAERIASEPFPTWLEPQLLPFRALEALLMGLIAWRTAR